MKSRSSARAAAARRRCRRCSSGTWPAQGRPWWPIDADINQHLGVALGLAEAEAAAIPPMGEHLPEIKDYLRGANPRIASADVDGQDHAARPRLAAAAARRRRPDPRRAGRSTRPAPG